MLGADVTIDQLEEVHIRRILRNLEPRFGAKTLGIDPATLYRKRKLMSFDDVAVEAPPGLLKRL